jgi:hypothetical protein
VTNFISSGQNLGETRDPTPPESDLGTVYQCMGKFDEGANAIRIFGPRLPLFLLRIARKGKSDWGYAPIPVIAPLIGRAIGMSSAVIFRYFRSRHPSA